MNLRLFLRVASVEARKRMSYRADFWITSLGTFAIQFGAAWILWRAVFAETGRATIGGYSEEAMFLYYGSTLLIGRFTRGTEFEMAVSQDIYDGALSRYLVYPAGYFRIRYAMQLGGLVPIAIQMVLFGALLPFVTGVRIGPAALLLAAAATLLGNVLNFMMLLPIQGVAFWADNVWSLQVAYRFLSGLLGGMLLPLALFPGPARAILEWTPFPCLFSLPADTLLGRVGPGGWAKGMAVSLGWCLLLRFASRAVWRRGELQYTGVGM